MDKYYRKYRNLIVIHKTFIIGYCAIAALSFLGGLVGIIICAIRNLDSLITVCVILTLVVPIVMLILYLVCFQWLWDKRYDRLNSELRSSSLSANEILELGKKLKRDLFSVAVDKRCKELGLESVPEWCVRDGVLP